MENPEGFWAKSQPSSLRENNLQSRAKKQRWVFLLLFRSHLTAISSVNEISSGAFSLAARYGEPFTPANFSVFLFFYHPGLSLPPSLCLPPTRSHRSARLPVAVSLFISPSVTTRITCRSLIFPPSLFANNPPCFHPSLAAIPIVLFFFFFFLLPPSPRHDYFTFFPPSGFPLSSTTSHLFSAQCVCVCCLVRLAIPRQSVEYIHIHVGVL